MKNNKVVIIIVLILSLPFIFDIIGTIIIGTGPIYTQIKNGIDIYDYKKWTSKTEWNNYLAITPYEYKPFKKGDWLVSNQQSIYGIKLNYNGKEYTASLWKEDNQINDNIYVSIHYEEINKLIETKIIKELNYQNFNILPRDVSLSDSDYNIKIDKIKIKEYGLVNTKPEVKINECISKAFIECDFIIDSGYAVNDEKLNTIASEITNSLKKINLYGEYHFYVVNNVYQYENTKEKSKFIERSKKTNIYKPIELKSNKN